jgi:2-keto-3-deoxy-L-rhamnonate aldolase RhmA
MAKLKLMLKENRLLKVFCAGQLCHPKLIEIFGMEGGFDAVWLDQEHVGLTIPQIEEGARAARAVGLDSFVRLTATDYATVMRPLEAGAGGIMAAQVRSAKETADVVRWAKFHPEGLRGVNGTGVDGRYGTMKLLDYMAHANADTFVAIQIEHIDAVNEVEKIAAVPDVDLLFIGPADLGQSMGIPGQFDHPLIWQATERVAKAAAAAGIHWAILPSSPAIARRCVDLGCKMLSMALDVWTLQRGIRAFRADYEM